MIIDVNEPKVRFDTLNVGDVFKNSYDGAVYVKLVEYPRECSSVNAVNLYEGRVAKFTTSELVVQYPNARLVLNK